MGLPTGSTAEDSLSRASRRLPGRTAPGPSLASPPPDPAVSPLPPERPAARPPPVTGPCAPPRTAFAHAAISAGRTPDSAVTRWPSGRTSSTVCAAAPG